MPLPNSACLSIICRTFARVCDLHLWQHLEIPECLRPIRHAPQRKLGNNERMNRDVTRQEVLPTAGIALTKVIHPNGRIRPESSTPAASRLACAESALSFGESPPIAASRPSSLALHQRLQASRNNALFSCRPVYSCARFMSSSSRETVVRIGPLLHQR